MTFLKSPLIHPSTLGASVRRKFPVRRSWIQRIIFIRHGLLISISITIIIILILTYRLSLGSSSYNLVRFPPQVTFRCQSNYNYEIRSRFYSPQQSFNPYINQTKLDLDSKVLLFVESRYSHLGKMLIETLEATRIKFKFETLVKSLPVLTNSDKGKFAVIIFENIEKYLHMDKWNREILDKYCREYKAGIVGFIPNKEGTIPNQEITGFPITIDYNMLIRDFKVDEESTILRLTKPGYLNPGPMLHHKVNVFHSNHSSYRPVTKAYLFNPETYNIKNRTHRYSVSSEEESTSVENEKFEIFSTYEETVSTVLQDKGLFDGIQRVIFSSGFDHWINRLLFIDSLSYLSHGKLSRPLDRYILIDIDDIFVGEVGTRVKPNDVRAILEAQSRLQTIIPGFKFNLGFSGKYYHRGNQEEDEGDDMLIANAHEFWWFCHMWGHSQPHLTENITALEIRMRMNKDFAHSNNIPIDSGYSVAPHHSGVYPVHEPLYEAWKLVWNVRATSTEEYPHLRPAQLRRGFIHRGIMVLPRQTCGLYTHTIFIDKYPGGRSKLDASIFGGELFYLFIYNPINVFMTHMSNYGNDRLALYTFESVINFVKCWTNIQLSTIPPVELANKYFQMHPEESDPIWMNPCKDKRHFSLWSSNKSCSQLPDFLIIGPQKTGTTALYTFLTMHPSIRSSSQSPETFEEVQFFSGKNYFKGLDWYMNFYPPRVKNSTSQLLFFEKSATYFDGDLVPMRAHSLLPDAKIIAILINPVRRAYSWYQHARSHHDPVALNYSFYEVITADEKAPKHLRSLRNRCLNPGCYATYLEKWINFYTPSKVCFNYL
uniref:[heparan sulfate]-glucosamine N-sulfotransferase n=1 Tax=Tetranychus urticae TaxID=32264 RepID=T1K1D0_TETUR